jgi:hypothetical protein
MGGKTPQLQTTLKGVKNINLVLCSYAAAIVTGDYCTT